MDYEKRTRKSKQVYELARKYFAGGVNHNARYYEPYPIFLRKASGKYIWDEDGNRYVDYWMGHTALILGHSPSIVTRALSRQLRNGTLYGMGSRLSVELAERINKFVPCAEMMRFCNTGAEATMYLVRLARAYSSRKFVIKIQGGWHGYNTELNKEVHYPFERKESAGITDEEQKYTISIPFNDVHGSESIINEHKNDAGVVIVEPVLGAGGCIPAKKEYLSFLREITSRYGMLLAFDEIITGFRLRLGGAQEYYGIKPDLAALGKIVGGGLPIGVVCGLKEIVSLADPSAKSEKFVSIGGGTFSENPLTMTAGIKTLDYLASKRSVYEKLEKLGDNLRRGVDKVLRENGLSSYTVGSCSLFMTHFSERKPENALHAYTSDRKKLHDYSLFQICNGNFLLPGHPSALSVLHTREDVDNLIRTAERFTSLP